MKTFTLSFTQNELQALCTAIYEDSFKKHELLKQAEARPLNSPTRAPAIKARAAAFMESCDLHERLQEVLYANAELVEATDRHQVLCECGDAAPFDVAIAATRVRRAQERLDRSDALPYL